MDDWTHPYQDVDVTDTQPTLLFEDGRVMEVCLTRAQQAEAARVAELEQAQAVNVDGYQAEADVPLPFEAPSGAALTF